MDEQRQDALDELVLECLERVDREGPSAIEALLAAHPDRADELRGRLKALLDAGLLDVPNAPPERLGDFRLGERLGGGGMGVVYAAVQESLGRDVALKIVRSDQLYFPGARERFRREVQLVARLAHRGIVPVHTVGEDGGVPYFAMELLRGATLAEALAALDGPPRRGRDLAEAVGRVLARREGAPVRVDGELYAGTGVDACVRITLAVAEALAHAHERGVLHRDVKPSNVMLTADGRALLFDFGLASSPDAASLTKSGTRVGSLAYMAPEQVRGEEADARSDVYGLGALLCEALTRAPPHEGSPEVIGSAILSGEPSPFARRRPDLPRDAATVIETALAHDPARRYPSASALARDLAHVLAGRPIEARRVGPAERGLRWVRRHPARAAALALVVLTPLALAAQQSVARGRIAEQSARAEANLDQALETLHEFVWGLGSGVLEHMPGFDDERVVLFEEALGSIEQLAAQRPGDAHLAALAVKLHQALGFVLLGNGRLDDAETRFRAGADLGAARGVAPDVQATVLNGLGLVLERRGSLDEAAHAYAEARALVGEGGTVRDLLDASAVSRNVARVERRRGRPEAARSALDDAATTAAAGVERAATEIERFEAAFAAAQVDTQLAAPTSGAPGAVSLGGTDPAARAAFERARAAYAGLLAAQPHRSDVVHAAATLAGHAAARLPPDEAEPVLREGWALVEPLCGDFPGRADYARTRAVLASNLGHVDVARGRLDSARAWFETACASLAPWMERGEEDASLLVVAAQSDVNLATVLVQLDLRADACEPAARGAERLERAMELTPDHEHLATSLAWARVQEGYGRIARGEAARTRALADAIPVAVLDDPVLVVAAGELYAGCADLSADAGEAAALRATALDRLERGLALGFAYVDYLRTTPEWASLREHPRFVELLAGAGG